MGANSKIGPERITIRVSEELKIMTEAAANYEQRNVSDICRIALTNYFTDQGYFSPDFITKLATANSPGVQKVGRAEAWEGDN